MFFFFFLLVPRGHVIGVLLPKHSKGGGAWRANVFQPGLKVHLPGTRRQVLHVSDIMLTDFV